MRVPQAVARHAVLGWSNFARQHLFQQRIASGRSLRSQGFLAHHGVAHQVKAPLAGIHLIRAKQFINAVVRILAVGVNHALPFGGVLQRRAAQFSLPRPKEILFVPVKVTVYLIPPIIFGVVGRSPLLQQRHAILLRQLLQPGRQVSVGLLGNVPFVVPCLRRLLLHSAHTGFVHHATSVHLGALHVIPEVHRRGPSCRFIRRAA